MYRNRASCAWAVRTWLAQYVVDMNALPPKVRSRRVFRAAALHVDAVSYELRIRPHSRYMGRPFTVVLRGKLD